MIEKKLDIVYAEYASTDDLEAADKELLYAATAALEGSYAPYSNFNVGAAVRLGNGLIVKGANQENSAYPSGLCAERTAMFSAASRYPDQPIVAIALVAAQYGVLQPAPTYPCGACRQVMAQYQQKAGTPMRIIVGSGKIVQIFDGVESLLPFIFDDI